MKKLSLVSILKEDIDLNKLHPKLIGLYSFIQAMNKSVSESPVPGLVVDIIPDASIKVNPGPLEFSRSSFKIRLNPRIGDISFDESGHDIFHALTTNLAKHFARLRPKNDKKAFDIDGINPGKASRYNIKRNELNKAEARKFRDLIKREFGIEDFNIKDLKSLRQKIEREKDSINAADNYEETTSYVQRGFPVDQAARMASDERRKRWASLANKANLLAAVIWFMEDWHAKHHFNTNIGVEPSVSVGATDDEKELEFYAGRRTRHPAAIEKYGASSTTSAMYLPQYEAEELFGNYLTSEVSFNIEESQPIKDVPAKVAKVGRILSSNKADFNEESLAAIIEKYRNYLETVFNNYNRLLDRYKAGSSKLLKSSGDE